MAPVMQNESPLEQQRRVIADLCERIALEDLILEGPTIVGTFLPFAHGSRNVGLCEELTFALLHWYRSEHQQSAELNWRDAADGPSMK